MNNLLNDDAHYYGMEGKNYLSNSDIDALLNDPKSFKKQKEKIAQLISEDREKAIRVALGEEQHKGVVPELVLEALSKSGDAELIARIGTESGLIKEATEMGRRIRAWGEVSPNNPIKIIGDLVKERSKSVEGKISSEVKKAISQVKKVKIPKETWASFIDSIKC